MTDSLTDLTTRIRAFADKRDWHRFHSPKNLSMALIVEAAELVEHFQWLSREQSDGLDRKKKQAVADELADILIYLVQLADRLDINLLAAADHKIEKNARKYPVAQLRDEDESNVANKDS